jgi:hypothetical protein
MNPTKEQITALVDYLLERDDWTTQKQIKKDLGMDGPLVRSIAHDTPLVISSSTGYKHYDNATDDEVMHNIASLYSRARAIEHRAKNLNYHHRTNRAATWTFGQKA